MKCTCEIPLTVCVNCELNPLIKERDDIADELRVITNIREHGCDCSDDDACLFVRQREELADALERAIALIASGGLLGAVHLDIIELGREALRRAGRQ